MIFFLAVLLLHWPQFGDPIAGLDEQFYLLAGDRLRAGYQPYIDIWDRKPAGLFYLYALFRLFPGDGVLSYQLAGTASLAATGWVASRIARDLVPPAAALAAGLAAAVYGVVLGLGFGEAPIFYDLPVATAAMLVITVRRCRSSSLSWRGPLAMLLCGMALTIKTSAVFESCGLGCLLLDIDRRAGVDLRRRFVRALLYVMLGLAPTLAIAAVYAAQHGFAIFWFANVQSIFLRHGGTSKGSIAGLAAALILLAPLILPALAEARSIEQPWRTVLLTWLAGTALSFVAVGVFAFHYALPMVTPLAILAARAVRRRWLGGAVCALIAASAVWMAAQGRGQARADRGDVDAIAAMLPPSVKTRCLFVYEGPTVLYLLSHACLPGRYVFPGHFTDPGERDALEKPSAAILAETLARRPAAIVAVPGLREGGEATPNDRLLGATLRTSYRLVGLHRFRLYGARRVEAAVWVLR